MPTTPLEAAERALRLYQSSLSALSTSIARREGVAFTVPRVRDVGVGAGMYKDDGRNPFQDELPLTDYEGAGMYKGSGDPRRVIPVVELRGRPATEHLGAGLAKIVRLRNQPPTRPDRFPGVLLCGPEQAAVLAMVKDARTQLLELLDQLGEHPEERRLARAGSSEHAMRHLMMMELMREPHVIDTEVDRVAFSWSGNSKSVKKLSRAQALHFVNSKNHLTETSSQWEKQLHASSSPAFAVVRPIEPFPVANLSFIAQDLMPAEKREAEWQKEQAAAAAEGRETVKPSDPSKVRRTAVLPLILLANRRMPLIHPLSVFDLDAKRRAPREDVLVGDVVIPALNLYEYRDLDVAGAR